MLERWTFRSYLSPEGEDGVRTWYLGLPDVVRAEIAVQIAYCRLEPIERWEERGEYKRLEGKLAQLESLQFVICERARKGQKSTKHHYRALGFSDSKRLEFTMLVGFEKAHGSL